MGYKVLVTLDLQSATEKQRGIFYSVLEKEKWNKIPFLTTTWKISFKDGVTRDSTIITIKNDLNKAKIESTIKIVKYALQLDTAEVLIDNM